MVIKRIRISFEKKKLRGQKKSWIEGQNWKKIKLTND
jgi:hypothetical protein